MLKFPHNCLTRLRAVLFHMTNRSSNDFFSIDLLSNHSGLSIIAAPAFHPIMIGRPATLLSFFCPPTSRLIGLPPTCRGCHVDLPSILFGRAALAIYPLSGHSFIRVCVERHD
jgi:hypothetical protein